MLQNVLCPFCFHSFALHEAPFRCMAPTCSGRGTDTVYATARGSAKMVMGQVIAPARRSLVLGIPREATCDTCKTISHTRLCPHCHFELSHDVGLITSVLLPLLAVVLLAKRTISR